MPITGLFSGKNATTTVDDQELLDTCQVNCYRVNWTMPLRRSPGQWL